jgi:CubicO group peptidase (beta-lactamase class C family)
MAKIGQLVLNKGTWQGSRILSAEWVEAMTRRWVPLGPTQGYGFLWWTRQYSSGSDTVNTVMADGWGGQRIMVFPSLDLVVVFTGGNYTQQHHLDEALLKYILPAIDKVSMNY